MGSWLIGYDITDPRRLQRIYRLMLKHATPLEYSIFLLTGTEHAHRKCMDAIIPLIDPATDDLRSYPLPKNGIQHRIGKPTLPLGIYWSALPGQFHGVETGDCASIKPSTDE